MFVFRSGASRLSSELGFETVGDGVRDLARLRPWPEVGLVVIEVSSGREEVHRQLRS